MRKNKNLRRLKLILITAIIAALGFTVRAQDALAVGIHVDENAAQIDEGEQKPQGEETKETENISPEAAEETGEEAEQTSEKESIELVKGEMPALQKIKDAAEGRTDIRQVMLAENGAVSAVDATPGAFDIEKGNITLSEKGGFLQKNKEEATIVSGSQISEQYTITGSTEEYGIRVESGASPVIQVQGMAINMLPDAAKKSGIYIEEGASVTLVLGTGDTAVKGTQYMPGITLEPGAALNITGDGELSITGGAGAAAVSGANNAAGGTLKVTGGARIYAYSDQGAACNVKVSSISNKILQGTLKAAASDADVIKVQAENKNNRKEKYEMKLPAGYRSFAVSTTAEGGEYVSYFPGGDGSVQSSHLLVDADAPARHNYNLIGAGNTFASLSNLEDQEVKYTVIFHGNGGTFHESQNDRFMLDGSKKIGYGQKIEEGVPKDTDIERNAHTLLGWYRIKDSTEDSDKWVKEKDEVVKDNMTLYASWKPDSCTVIYRSGNKNVKEVKNYHYDDTIKEADTWKPGSDVNPGYTLVYWVGEDGKRWEFGDGGTKLKKATTVLEAVWLLDCTVIFDPNAPGEEIKGWPRETTVPATWLVKSPDEQPARPGYRFTTWYKDNACTEKWDFDSDTAKGEKLTLYAGWGAETTVVEFHVDKEQGETVTPTTQSVGFGNTITKPSASKPKREGNLSTEYEVEGWYTDEKLAEKWDFSSELKDPDGKFDLYAKWKQKTCYAVLTPGDKEAVPQEDIPKQVPYGSSLKNQYNDSVNDTYKKKGYKIKGWYTAAGKEWKLDQPLTEDVTLKPRWEAEVYEVKFVTPEDAPQLPENEKKQDIVYNRTVKAPVYPETEDAWKGHTFLGWNTKEDGSGDYWKFSGEAGANPVEGPVTLYAQWQWDEYTVTFRTYAGDENPPSEIEGLHYGDKIQPPAEPVREHYGFLGWFKDEEHTQPWDFDADEVTGNMTLYAGWEGKIIDVTLHVRYEPEHAQHPGEEVTVKPEGDIRYGDFLDKEILESLEDTKHRDGYTLNGWYTTPDYAQESIWEFADMRAEPADEQLNLYAYWTWDEYTVTFVTYDGDETNNIPALKGVHFGEKITRPENDPVREHYEFDGWYPDLQAEEKKQWDFGRDVVTGDMSLYADWIPDVYTLSFETNGGTALEPVQVTYGTFVEKDALKTKRAGYELTGWYKDAGLTEKFAPESDYVDQDMTIYAAWELEKYSVRLHYRADKESQEEEVVTYTDVYRAGDYISKPDKTIPHKTLSSWFTEPNWQKEKQWVFKRDKVSGDTDLYAYWSDTLYKVHFETYGGTEMEDKELAWGSLLEAPETPEHEGCTFGGWYKDTEYKTEWNFEEDFVDGDITVYARWNPNMYTVTFDTAGGSAAPEPQNVPYGSLIAEPEAPVREGYTFTGWKSDGAGEGNWNFKQNTVAQDMTLTAQWTEEKAPPQDPQGGKDGGTPAAGGSGNGAAGGSGTPDGTLDSAKQALTDAADTLKKILTGDKAPLTYAVTGIFLSAAAIIWLLRRRYK